MRILIALDKFKGSMSAWEAGSALGHALADLIPDAEIDICPIADGGEGTTEALVMSLGGRFVMTSVTDARGRAIQASYGLVVHGGKPAAIMEMSAASGLAQVLDLPLDPASASTRGTGQMIRHAMDQGAEEIIIGLGGSATNDGGAGMARELGWEFLDANDLAVSDLPAQLNRVVSLRPGKSRYPKIIVASDVTNPLCGPNGASFVYGPQKGVTDPGHFDQLLSHLANIVVETTGHDLRNEPGAGAAGGLGFGLMAFCNATIVSGFDLVAELTGLKARVARADLVITGEGRLDAQTLHGKGPAGVASMARELGRPVAGFGGGVEWNAGLEKHFDLLVAIKPDDMALEEAIRRGPGLMEESVEREANRIREWISRIRSA